MRHQAWLIASFFILLLVMSTKCEFSKDHKAVEKLLRRSKRFLVSSTGWMNFVGYVSSVLNIFNIYDNRIKACKYGGSCAARDYDDLLLSLLTEMGYQLTVIQDDIRQTNLRIDQINSNKQQKSFHYSPNKPTSAIANKQQKVQGSSH